MNQKLFPLVHGVTGTTRMITALNDLNYRLEQIEAQYTDEENRILTEWKKAAEVFEGNND
jgi:hypothetical protein